MFYDLEDGIYRTYPDGDEATGRVIRREIESKDTKIRKLEKEKQELIEFLKEEQDRLARECSHIYEDSLGRTRLVSEDIYNEVSKILSKIEKR